MRGLRCTEMPRLGRCTPPRRGVPFSTYSDPMGAGFSALYADPGRIRTLRERDRQRVLQVALHSLEIARNFRTVGDAVVGGESDVHPLAGDDGAVLDHWDVHDRADGKDRRLRRVDDGDE